MISIITPTYNSGAYLEKCIQSIVNQEFDDYEHIIVDGGSTDNTLAIIKKYESLYNIKWISEKDNGMYDAISKGFKMAKGDILCWLNSDDIYMPWTLKVVEHVFQNTDIDWCTGVPTQINENGEMYFPIKTFVTYPQFCIRKGFKEFFDKEVPSNPLKAEYLIPIFIGELLEQGKMSVKVLKTSDTWYGMTYHEDVASVKDSFRKMQENGVYKADLFSDL